MKLRLGDTTPHGPQRPAVAAQHVSVHPLLPLPHTTETVPAPTPPPAPAPGSSATAFILWLSVSAMSSIVGLPASRGGTTATPRGELSSVPPPNGAPEKSPEVPGSPTSVDTSPEGNEITRTA